MADRPIPDRPLLGRHVRARRHLTADGSHVVLHDGSRALALGEREWCVARQMDGTRDLSGLVAASRNAGRGVGEAHLRAFVEQLHQLGLLATGLDDARAERAAPTVARDVPLIAAPGRRFSCTGAGGCCELFDTMLATPLEAMRARATCPDHADLGPALSDVFTPERGLDAPLLTLPLGPRGCAYLEADRRCALHAEAGPEAKPFSCRVHPLAYLDVGAAIRVSPRLSCACAFGGEGPELDPPARGALLDPRVRVATLGTTRAGASEWAPEELLAFLGDVDREADVAETFEALARSLGGALPPAPDVAALAEAELGKVPSERRALRAALEATARAAGATEESPRAADERLYLESFVFLPLFDEATLEAALATRARRVRLARRFASSWPHPLATVEALAHRGVLP